MYLYGEFSVSSHPQHLIGNILLVSAWKGMMSLAPGSRTMQDAEDVPHSESICFREDLIYGFIDIALEHYNSG